MPVDILKYKLCWANQTNTFAGKLGFAKALELPAENILSQAEKVRYQKMKHANRRMEFVTGRFVIKSLLSDTCHIEHFSSVNVDANYWGMPFVNETKFPYNIGLAHSLGQVAGMICDRGWNAGLDVEKPDPGRNEFSLSLHSEDELQILRQAGVNEFEGLILWTMKESLMKFLGLGFTLGRELTTVQKIEPGARGLCARFDHFPALKADVFFERDLWVACCYMKDFSLSLIPA